MIQKKWRRGRWRISLWGQRNFFRKKVKYRSLTITSKRYCKEATKFFALVIENLFIHELKIIIFQATTYSPTPARLVRTVTWLSWESEIYRIIIFGLSKLNLNLAKYSWKFYIFQLLRNIFIYNIIYRPLFCHVRVRA